MTFRKDVSTVIALATASFLLAGPAVYTNDFDALKEDLWRSLDPRELERLVSPAPPILRGTLGRGVLVYRQRVNGVVLIATDDSSGAGVLVSNRGEIITNEHVVRRAHRAQGSEWVAVWFKPSHSSKLEKHDFLLANVVRKDVERDLALIKLVLSIPSEATIVPLAATLPEVGQEVFTIGHPLSYFWSFTQGIVSQVRPDHKWQYADGIPRTAAVIQTQAPVNPGSSGGPLLDEDGAIIGIVIGGATEAQGVYFAVAVPHVRQLLHR